MITQCKQKDSINQHIASAGVKSCLREQNHVIKKFHASPKVFGLMFPAGLRVKDIKLSVCMLVCSFPYCSHNFVFFERIKARFALNEG